MPSLGPALMWPDSSSACVLACRLPTLQMVLLCFPKVDQVALDIEGVREMTLGEIKACLARLFKPSILAILVAAMPTRRS